VPTCVLLVKFISESSLNKYASHFVFSKVDSSDGARLAFIMRLGRARSAPRANARAISSKSEESTSAESRRLLDKHFPRSPLPRANTPRLSSPLPRGSGSTSARDQSSAVDSIRSEQALRVDVLRQYGSDPRDSSDAYNTLSRKYSGSGHASTVSAPITPVTRILNTGNSRASSQSRNLQGGQLSRPSSSQSARAALYHERAKKSRRRTGEDLQ
jgi:hypothetical protein